MMRPRCLQRPHGASGGGVASAARRPAAAPRLAAPHRPQRPLAARCSAQGGRSPRSTMSEAGEKGRQQQQQAHTPRAAAGGHAEPEQGQQQPQQQPQEQRKAGQGQGQAWWRERRRQAQRAAGMTKLEELMRDTPGLNRLVDGTLILGDVVMVVATEVASERVPLDTMPYLAGVAACSWVLAGAVLGDYKGEPDPDANPLSNSLGWPVVVAIANACITWAAAMVPSMLGFSVLVANYLVPTEVVVDPARNGILSPQLEVSVALLVTMLCWRGMATRLRMRD
ncbi:hypothetical protein Rsub_11022 [Raphidocelis subcapitata]|uniref:Uncharacterized protein n=1 Tax=Raphidocelis subcapitata TaxID=307507 RepID=A0A2V0PK08_9CHLO|nr:hypothetical protein Rsub_11022 [Raphidocelis subcapitata]|eukprot:GBF97375.1 hypothetical protein Rsub_11022 [Raphidocelis subcapitata]